MTPVPFSNRRGRRSALFVPVLVLLALVAASCGTDESPATSDAPPAAAEVEEAGPAAEETAEVAEAESAPEETAEVAEAESAPEETAEVEEAEPAPEETAEVEPAPEETAEAEPAPEETAEVEEAEPEAVPVELDKVVATHHFTSLLAMPTQFGRDKGFFERNGIDLELISVPAGQTSIATLIAGDAHVAHQGTTQFMTLRANHDQPMKVLGSMFETLGNALIVRPGLDLPNKGKYPEVMHDMVGLDVGVSSLGGQQELTVGLLLQEAGLPADSVNFVNAGYTTSTVLPALQGGDADIVITVEPVSTIASSGAAGEVFEVALDLRKGQGPPQFVGWIQNCYGSLEDVLNERPDVYRRFDETIQEAKAYMADTANRDEVVEWLIDAMGVDQGVAEALYDNNMFGFTTNGFTPEGIKKISDTQVATGVLDRPVTFEELVWQPPE